MPIKLILILKLTLIFSVSLLAGCIAKKSPSAPPPAFISHKVTYNGETLALISKWYSGTASNWKQIDAANPDLKAKNIKINDSIKIPQEIVSNYSPMPRSFVNKYMEKIREAKKNKALLNPASNNVVNPPMEAVEEAEALTIEVNPTDQAVIQKETPLSSPSDLKDDQVKHDELIEKLLK